MNNFIPLLNPVSVENLQLLEGSIFLYENTIPKDVLEQLQKINHQKFRKITLYESQLKNVPHLKQQLRKVRYQSELIIVAAKSAGFLQHAINDRRVDGVKVNPSSSLKLFNPPLFSRMKRMQKILEIDLSAILAMESSKKYRKLFRILHGLRGEIPVLLSYTISNYLQIRAYRNIRTLGAYIGIDKQWTKESHILQIIYRNREKLGEFFFADGILREEGTE